MGELKRHWTEHSVNSFLYRIAADFIVQLEQAMDTGRVKQSDLANSLHVSEGRVSQVLNNPGNLTLKNIVQYARALGKKVAIVSYDDKDSNNAEGPINSAIFEHCWERAGQPRDFFDLDVKPAVAATVDRFDVSGEGVYRRRVQPTANVGSEVTQSLLVIGGTAGNNSTPSIGNVRFER